MPGTLGLILEPRVGPRISPRIQRYTIGSDVTVWVDVRDVLTRAQVPGATGQAALYWLPGTRGNDSPAQPVLAVEVSPGTWQLVVPTTVPGLYVIWFGIDAPARQTTELTVLVTATGRVDLTVTGTPDWGPIQAVAAAVALSAIGPEARRVVAEYAAGAVAEAIEGQLDGISEAAATAATAAVAERLRLLASTASVEALGRRVDSKASIEALNALGRQLADKADAAAVQQVTDDLVRRVDDLEQAGPGAPQITALTIAKAFGAPVFDFSDARNSALLTL